MNTEAYDPIQEDPRVTALLPPPVPPSANALLANALRRLAGDVQAGRVDDTTMTFIAGALRALEE